MKLTSFVITICSRSTNFSQTTARALKNLKKNKQVKKNKTLFQSKFAWIRINKSRKNLSLPAITNNSLNDIRWSWISKNSPLDFVLCDY